jgi:iron complex outermembrane receptor protein
MPKNKFLGAALSILVPAAVMAAEAGDFDSGQLQEITVTAEKRSTSLQDTPLAVSAFDADLLKQRGSATVNDLQGLIPNLQMPGPVPSQSSQTFFLRGIGESDPIQNPAVAVYLDDSYVPRALGDLFDLADVERVEVLRGPQGTLYGRNSSAGAIRLITKDPTDETHAVVEAGTGNFGAFNAGAYVSGALVPGLLDASLTFLHKQRDGFTYDPTIKRDVNDIDTNAARVKLRYRPTEDWDVQLSADGTRDRSTTDYYTPLRQPGAFNPYVSYAEDSPQDNYNGGGAALRVIHPVSEGLTLKSVTTYRGFEQDPVAYDNDGEADVKNINVIRYHEQDLTQEVQALGDFKDLKLVGGLFYFHENFSADRNNFSGAGPATEAATVTTGFAPLPNYPQDQVSDTHTDSIALYGQGDYSLTDKLTVTAGLRLTHEEVSFSDQVFKDTVTGLRTNASVVPLTLASHVWNDLSPKGEVSYAWTPDLLTYAEITRGFKGGGFDNRATASIYAERPFEPESVLTYETGVKSELFDHRLRTNLALFYNDYSDMQTSVVVPGTTVTLRQNADSAHTTGVEYEGAVAPLPGLEVGANVAYLFSNFDSFANAAGGSATGKALPYAPRWMVGGSVSYDLPLGVPGTARLTADGRYQSVSNSTVLNLWQTQIPVQVSFNAAASYTTEDGRWTGTLAAHNLFDRANVETVSYSGAPVNYWDEIVAPPRLVTFTLRYSL